MIRVTIPLEPVGQMRARHGRWGTHKAAKQRTREEQLIAYLVQNRPDKPLTGPLRLFVGAYMPIPKSYSKSKREQALRGELRPAKKPDLDNIIKHVKDCANGILWADDKQIVEYLPGTGKFYSDDPRWVIAVEEV